MSEREREQIDKDRLETMCVTFDTLREEARQKMWDLMKIPIAPATLIAVGLEVAVVMGWLQKEIGHLAMIADLGWASYKVVTGVLSRSRAVAGSETELAKIQCFLHTQNSRAAMMHRSIIDSHDPDIRQGLSDRGVY